VLKGNLAVFNKVDGSYLHTDPVDILESFRALKLYRLDNFPTLKSKDMKEYLRTLKPSRF
jgi:hypothetical protein